MQGSKTALQPELPLGFFSAGADAGDCDAVTEYQVSLLDVQATSAFGCALGASARAGDCLLLDGELGAGKTSLTQGLARGLGIAEVVSSPTFSLLNEYGSGRLRLSHFDLYRLASSEIAGLGFVDIWDHPPGVVVIEWAERAEQPLALLPEDALCIRLKPMGDGRLAVIQTTGQASERWLSEARIHVAGH